MLHAGVPSHMTCRHIAISRVRYDFLRSDFGESEIERTSTGILDSIKDIQILQCDGLVDASQIVQSRIRVTALLTLIFPS